MTLNGQQFRMQTNMKAAPNSQGTLFQGNNAQRYPRGYTPERQRDVLNSIHPSTRAAMRDSPQTRAIIENVARSTAPANRLTDLEFKPADTGMGRKRGMAAGLQIGGMYQHGRRMDQATWTEHPFSRVTVAPGQEGTTTPIHEIGHHVSRITGRASSEYNTVARKGADEGFAENFAERNWRDRRGRPSPDFSTNPLRWSNNMGDAASKTFAKNFEKERVGSPSAERQAKASASYAARGAQPALFDVGLELRGRKSTKAVAQGGLARRLGDG
jgi:hypothetical protein